MIVLVLGAVSLALLSWIDLINQRQHTRFAVANVIGDLRLRTATSHLWLEETIQHPDEAKRERSRADLREAERLAAALTGGGETTYGVVLAPLEVPELRQGAEDVQGRLSEFAAAARERARQPELDALDAALNSRFEAVDRSAARLEAAIEQRGTASYTASRRLVFGISLAWVGLVAVATVAVLGRERAQKRVDEILYRTRDELERRVAERTGELAVLSRRLLTAQETERGRISKELHDELGHDLVRIKLWFRFLKAELEQDPSKIDEKCDELAGFVDHAIENVRRLSLELSPSVLEDLGLTEALRWLADNYKGNPQTRVVSSLVDVDHLFSSKDQIIVYRIIQEALTNVSKHAQATRVSLAAERHGDALSLVVEDDGAGFDVKRPRSRDGSDTGLGLATMAERAQMLGGALSVTSEPGKGTRVTLRVPLRPGRMP